MFKLRNLGLLLAGLVTTVAVAGAATLIALDFTGVDGLAGAWSKFWSARAAEAAAPNPAPDPLAAKLHGVGEIDLFTSVEVPGSSVKVSTGTSYANAEDLAKGIPSSRWCYARREAYADVKMYAGLNSFDRARFVSDMLAEETIRKQDYSYQAMMEGMGVGSKELGRRLMMPNEILAMPRHLAWTFVRGLNPMLLSMTHYGAVAPWRDWVGENPIEGAPLRAEPRFTLHYPEVDHA